MTGAMLEHNIERAVRSAVDLSWFAGYLSGLLDAGVEQPVLEEALLHIREAASERDDERIADLMLDGLDLLTGWCGPGFVVGRGAETAQP